MAGNEQFDEYLGGSQSLPPEVHIMKLVSARASEIAAMTYSIENPQQTKLVFQKLPVYMRRRVMSHNAKRLPRRLREAHLNQMKKSGLPPKVKRPSRKYRRRPRNLLAEYTRRQRSKIWLETHIWHAKRFRMIEKWGYKIASYANDKCFRANYRAVARHCLMQDISYYTCVEINGPEEILKETLKSHCNPLELSFAAKIFMTGTREGTVMFFKKNGYPRFPIGHVHFLWRPNQSNLKIIWIWVHPSFLDDFVAEITSSFEFKSDEAHSTSSDDRFTKSCLYINEKNCTMNIYKNTFNRFRFYGPLTLRVLTEALSLPNFDENFYTKLNIEQFDDDQMECEDESQSSDKFWHIEYYNKQENMESLKIQKQLWQTLKTLPSPSQLPRNVVLGFTVLDPRFNLPNKRTKPQREAQTTEAMLMSLLNANLSPIWEQEIRQKVSKICATTSAINKMRSKCLVPGLSNDKHFNEGIMAKIPILLIQRPGMGNTGLCSGIDIIFPSNWAVPFWIACIFRCARVGALRESKSIAFEYENMQSPDVNDPDTPVYTREALSTKLELKEKYFRYPPNRRVNFTKFGISSPFFCEWKILMKEWAETEEFFVLRNRKLLKLLQDRLPVKEGSRKKYDKSNNLTLQNAFESKNCLVRVKVSIVQRGCPKRFAIICMPTNEDIEKFKNSRYWSGPVEKLNVDPNESVRKISRKNHLALLKRLKRQRICHKKSLIDKLSKILSKELETFNYNDKSKSLSEINRKVVYEQSQKMSQLYLPECTNVRYSCDREVMGYVTMGDFSFTEAKGIGLGYTTLNSLIELINKNHTFVLVRNIQTKQYRIAKLEVTI
ncbi:Ribonucleases P/MRP protein subunit POP1 [Habropoda laboriosa]|uniref:Ribonucleases P/MRP protein subunit POP1 n=1 Tax=Habropoda laboriosa TaxID=597456 RepID=A0A0L7R471_9HYME|nr:PREDICTED: ribonucleases P/MRP protein subunit POP1 [Habropoda laboriosa]KOC65685.1 Ribonucleases P/MRP protein subunit POP1 [Habropoda laboriosa]